MDNFAVECVLIELGSKTNIIFVTTLSRMDIPNVDISLSGITMASFNGSSMHATGQISLMVSVNPYSRHTDFVFMNNPSSHNAIMGRSWLYKLKECSSTFYQIICYPAHHGVQEIRGNSIQSRKVEIILAARIGQSGNTSEIGSTSQPWWQPKYLEEQKVMQGRDVAKGPCQEPTTGEEGFKNGLCSKTPSKL